MELLVLLFLGILLGALGSEILRAKKPKLVSRVEDYAKRLVSSGDAALSKEDKDDEP